MALSFLLFAVLLHLTIAIVAVVARGRVGSGRIYAASATVSAAACISALFAGSQVMTAALPIGVPWLEARFRLDAVSTYFAFIVNLGATAAAVYGIGYGRHEHEPLRVLPFFPVFLAAMNSVLLADDAFSFLFSWELMSLASWLLVLSQHRQSGTSHAGYVYLVMASFGTLCLLLGFGLLAGAANDYAFAAIRSAPAGDQVWSHLAIALLLIGTASKAGLVPLHVWLPLAHPAAPSHVSALMSGVMTKVAVYGAVRCLFDLAYEPGPWWAAIILVVGMITVLLGVLHAMMERDLKRLLAYSTVENVGLVFIGLGLALAFRANGLAGAAAVAVAAALFHALNHSLFKTLLFLGSGAVQSATGHRDIDRMGGLVHRMPATAAIFLVGAAAISGLPLLNGFASDWLTFQALLLSPALPEWFLKLEVPAVAAVAALAAALTAALFVRTFGIAFLGRPRSTEAAAAGEVDGFSLTAMAGLAALCLTYGLAPGLAIGVLEPAAASLLRVPELSLTRGAFALAAIDWERGAYAPLLLLVAIITLGAVSWYVVGRYAKGGVRRSPAWDCGFPDPSPATQYSAGGFSQPIRRVFGPVFFAARETVDMPEPGDLRPATIDVCLRDHVWRTVFAPTGRAICFASARLNRLQFFTIRRYLTLVYIVLLGLLSVVALWR